MALYIRLKLLDKQTGIIHSYHRTSKTMIRQRGMLDCLEWREGGLKAPVRLIVYDLQAMLLISGEI